MKSVDILSFLARLHISNDEKMKALNEGIEAIKTLEDIRGLLASWKELADKLESKLEGCKP